MTIYDLARLWVHDDLAFSTSFGGTYVDESKYDIRPKKKFLEELIQKKEDEIAFTEKQQKVNNDYYEERKRQLVEERDKLVKQKQEQG